MDSLKPKKKSIEDLKNSLGKLVFSDDVVKLVGETIKAFGEVKKLTDAQISDLGNKIDAIVEAQNDLYKVLSNKIDTTTSDAKMTSLEAEKTLRKDIENLRDAIYKLDVKATQDSKTSKQETQNLIDRSIAVGIEQAVRQAKNEIIIPDQLSGEEIRNSLEALNGDDRLDVNAIKGIKELFDSIPKQEQQKIMAANRYLYELLDVDASGIQDGQTLAWDATLNTWFPSTPSTGAVWGLITGTLSAQTDLQNALNDKYDASNPAGYISNISGQDLSTADNTVSQFITIGDVDLSGLIPYTGATTDADLGTHSVTLGSLQVRNFGDIQFLDNTDTLIGSMQSSEDNKWVFGGSNTNTFDFTTATGKTYTFPNNTGTVALTSDIPTVPVFRSETPSGTIDGANADFTTTSTINFIVTFALNGTFIHPSEYSVTGNTITFTSPPDISLSGLPFTVVYY